MCISRVVTKVVREEHNLTHQDQLVCIRHLEEPPIIKFRIEKSLNKIRTRDSANRECVVQNLNSDRRNGFGTDGQPNEAGKNVSYGESKG
jgi:hypothetical protein